MPFRSFAFVLSTLLVVPPAATAQPPGGETPMIGGDAAAVKPDPTKPDAAGTKRLAAAGVEFDYPATFRLDADESVGFSSWVLEGPGVNVSVFAMAGFGSARAAAEDVARETKRDYENARESVAKIQLAGKLVRGHRITGKAGGETVREDIFPAANGERQVLLSIRSVLAPDGGEPAEAAAVRKMVSETFKRTGKATDGGTE